MDDSISRQDAIDAVEKGCGEWKGIFQRIKENIEKLPSAQPQIIHCKDCKHWDEMDIGSTMAPEARRCRNAILSKRYTTPLWFCADGVRKDG